MNSVSFSPDGSRIVSGSDDKSVRVWDASSGECVLGPLEGHTSGVTIGVVFSGRVAHRVRVVGQERAGVGRVVGGVRARCGGHSRDPLGHSCRQCECCKERFVGDAGGCARRH